MIRADATLAPVGGGLNAAEFRALSEMGHSEVYSPPTMATPTTWRLSVRPVQDVLSPAGVCLVCSELGRVAVDRVCPRLVVLSSSPVLSLALGVVASRALRSSARKWPLACLGCARLFGGASLAIPVAALGANLAVAADTPNVQAVVVPVPPPQFLFVSAVLVGFLVLVVKTFERLLQTSSRDAATFVIAAAAFAAGSLADASALVGLRRDRTIAPATPKAD